MNFFKPSEFSEDIKHADPELLNDMDKLRAFARVKIYPSPVPGALARFDIGTSDSRHYAVNRKSDALDFFTSGDPFEVFTKIIQSGLFKRVGVYFDTYFKGRKEVMFHVDEKDQHLLWSRVDKKYLYSNNPVFYRNLFKQFF